MEINNQAINQLLDSNYIDNVFIKLQNGIIEEFEQLAIINYKNILYVFLRKVEFPTYFNEISLFSIINNKIERINNKNLYDEIFNYYKQTYLKLN